MRPLFRFDIEDDILPCLHWKHNDVKILSRVVLSKFSCSLPHVNRILDKWSMPEGSIETYVKGCPYAKFCKYYEA